MKKISIVSLALLLSACASDSYIAEVKSESYVEEYQTDMIPQPLTQASNEFKEMNISEPMNADPVVKAPVVLKETEPKPKPMVKIVNKPAESKKSVKIVPPSQKQVDKTARFGYTVQVVAVGNQAKVQQYVSRLPDSGQPIWENYKIVNGTKWYTVLYGDYANSTEARKAIAQLPQEFRDLKPFVKSIDAIKNSPYPTLNKLN